MSDDIIISDEWINPGLVLDADEITLVGIDGNAGTIMSHVNKVLKASGNPKKVQDAYRLEAMSGDYDHLLVASMTYLGEEK